MSLTKLNSEISMSMYHRIREAMVDRNDTFLFGQKSQDMRALYILKLYICAEMSNFSHKESVGPWDYDSIIAAINNNQFIIVVSRCTVVKHEYIAFKVSRHDPISVEKFRRRYQMLHPLMQAGWMQYKLNGTDLDPTPTLSNKKMQYAIKKYLRKWNKAEACF